MRRRWLSALVMAPLLLGCGGWKPARFVDRAPVMVVHDDDAIAVPAKSVFINELYHADVYVRRELVRALDPRRIPEALDVNSLDEVPRSSWYAGVRDPTRPLRGYLRDGPPRAPFERLEDEEAAHPNGYRIRDARGLVYEMLPDLEDRAGMRTGALVAASRLVHALGYHTPEVHLVFEADGDRIAAIRWPLGVDLGPTPINRQRDDDPNDHLPHVERRTLRVWKLIAAWLDLPRLDPWMLRDVYVGKPGQGHVQHAIFGLSDALGVGRYLKELAFATNPDRQHGNFFFKLFTMGLSPKPPGYLPQTPWPSVGRYFEHLRVKKYKIAPPFEPSDRMTRGDAYWIAKRMAAIPLPSIASALQAAELDPGPTNYLYSILHIRRAAVIAWGYDQTTPLELMASRRRTKKSWELVLGDLGIEQGFIQPKQREYQVRVHDASGAVVWPERKLRPRGSVVGITLPMRLREHGYVVVRVRAKVEGDKVPRHVELHLRAADPGFRVVGIRH